MRLKTQSLQHQMVFQARDEQSKGHRKPWTGKLESRYCLAVRSTNVPIDPQSFVLKLYQRHIESFAVLS
jgi:hypothetical protein